MTLEVGLFSGLKKVGKSVSKAVTKSPIVKAVEKDVSGAVKQVKKGVSSPEGFKNLVISILKVIRWGEFSIF